MNRPRVCFVVESGTDARLVDGLAEHCTLTVLARRVPGAVPISRPIRSDAAVHLGPVSIGAFAAYACGWVGANAGRLDFVLAQGYSAAALASRAAAAARRLPSALLVCSPLESYYATRRDQDGFGKPFRAYEFAALRFLAAANARTGARYIALSRYLADVVSPGGERGAVDIIPVYGVDTKVFEPSGRPRSDIRRDRGIPDDGAVVFFSSRVAPEKDAATLLRAIARLAAEGRSIRVLHRSGGYRQFLQEAHRLGIADRIVASDAVHPHDELPLDYAASDLCVQASRDEGLGYSVLEALACGVPVVASAVGGLRETIVDGLTGWTCRPRDPEAMARAIAAALDDPEEGARRARAGRAMVQERFERAQVFARLADYIRERMR